MTAHCKLLVPRVLWISGVPNSQQGDFACSLFHMEFKWLLFTSKYPLL